MNFSFEYSGIKWVNIDILINLLYLNFHNNSCKQDFKEILIILHKQHPILKSHIYIGYI